MRVSWGFDVHRLGGEPPVRLAGVLVDPARGVVATSDGDLVAHAVADALLGVAGLGDLGAHFPASDPKWEGADSMELLGRVAAMCSGIRVTFLDVTVIAQQVRVAPHRNAIRDSLAWPSESSPVGSRSRPPPQMVWERSAPARGSRLPRS